MRFSRFLILIVFLISCTSDLDFSQYEKTEVTQVFTVASFYYNVNQKAFLNDTGTQEIPILFRESEFDVFTVERITKFTTKVEYNIEYKNTFDRDFIITFDFLNDANPTQSRSFTATQNNEGKQQFVFQGADLELLKQSNRIKVSINLQPSTTLLDSNKEVLLSLKSAFVVTLEIGKND